MEEEVYAFSTIRPRTGGKTIACVPYRFVLKKDKLGRKIAEPAGFPGLVEGHTASGYLAFASESELKAILDEIKMRFGKHGIENFDEVENAVTMSKAYLKVARVLEGKGKFSMRTAKRRKAGLIPVEAKTASDLEGIDWFSAAKLKVLDKTNGKDGVLKAWSVTERPDKPMHDISVKQKNETGKKEEEFSFGTPFDFVDMKGTLSLYEDMKNLFGPDNVKRTVDFEAQRGVTYTKNPHLRREAGTKES